MSPGLPEGHIDAQEDWYEEGEVPSAAPGSATRRRRWQILAVVALVIIALAWSWQNAGKTPSGSAAYVKTPGTLLVVAPARRIAGPRLTGELLDGSRFDSAVWQGKIIVVNIWGSWCAPCRAEAPELVRVANATYDQGVRFLGIDVRDNRSSAQAFARKYKVPYASLFDQSSRTTLAFRGLPPNAIPTTIVLDRQGRIAARAIGRITEPQLSAVLARLQEESP